MTNGKLIKTVGYILLAVSTILFLLIFVVPWLPLSKKQIAVTTVVLIVASEILFYSSILLIGKSFIDKLWAKMQFWKKNPEDAASS